VRGQATFEFLLVLSAIGIVFLIAFIIASSANANLVSGMSNSAARRDAMLYASAVNFVYLSGPGASFNLSSRNIEAGENITISAFSVSAIREDGSGSASLLYGGVNGSAAPHGDVRVVNSGGGIHFEQ